MMLPYRDSRLTRAILAVFFVLVAVYAYYEGRGLLFGPSITVAGRAMEVSTQYIRIEGRADRIASLTMNGQPVTVTEDGSFSEPYVLVPGYNRITLDAADKYGKHAERTIEIVYTATSSTSSLHANTTTGSSTLQMAP